jgi:hypothetical protein
VKDTLLLDENLDLSLGIDPDQKRPELLPALNIWLVTPLSYGPCEVRNWG